MMFQLVYQSEPTNAFENDDCSDILLQSRVRNAKREVTGALLFTGSHFLQALEGDKEDVQAVFTRVRKDRRHRAVKVLFEGEVPEAEFGFWSMAFNRANIIGSQDLEQQLKTLNKNASEKTRDLFREVLTMAAE